MIHLNAPNTPAAPDPRFFLELLIPSSKCSKLIFFLDLEICQIEIHHLIQQKRRIISVQRTVPRAHGAGDQSRPCRIASRTRRYWPTLVTWMGCCSAARRRAPSPGRRPGWTMPGSKVARHVAGEADAEGDVRWRALTVPGGRRFQPSPE